jgi:hypothetical protein
LSGFTDREIHFARNANTPAAKKLRPLGRDMLQK